MTSVYPWSGNTKILTKPYTEPQYQTVIMKYRLCCSGKIQCCVIKINCMFAECEAEWNCFFLAVFPLITMFSCSINSRELRYHFINILNQGFWQQTVTMNINQSESLLHQWLVELLQNARWKLDPWLW